MRLGAVIVDNRPLPPGTIERHSKYLDCEVVHIDYYPIKAIQSYNGLLTSVNFWEALNFDKVLIFQHDSGLLRTGIEEFLQYDFIGAPIKHIPFPAMNGGLSLRSTEAMIRCIKDTAYNPNIHGNEDMHFCNQLKKLGGNLPTKEVAQKFSVETIFNLGSFGYHAINKYLSPEQCNQILTQYK